MKKLTHLLMMLCVFAGAAWAGPTDLPQITTDLENPIYYTISNTRSTSGRFVYWTENGIKDNTPLQITDAYKFYFTGDSHSNLKIHNAATSLLFSGIGAWTEEGVACEISVTPHSSNAGLAIKFSDTALNELNYADGYTTWSANDAGSIFVIESADLVVTPEGNKFYTIECPLFESVQGVKKGLYVDGEGKPGWNTIDLTDKAYYWTLIVNEDKYAFKNLKTGTYLNGTTMSESSVEGTINRLSSSQFNIVVNGTTVHANNHNSGNGAGSNIVSWQGSANSASAWTFVEQADPDAAVPVIIKYSFTYGGETKYTQETATIVGQQYPAFTVSFPFGVSATKPEGTISDEDIVEGVKTVEIALSVNLPFIPAADNASIEHWYYIQMHSNPEHTKYIQYMDTYIEWLDTDIDVTDKDSYTWAFVGNPFDGFKLVNMKAGINKAVNTNGSDTPKVGDYETGVIWEIKNSRVNNDSEHFCFKFPGGNYMNAQSGKVAFWSDNDQGSTMWVTERDLTGATELQALIDQVKAAQGNYVAGTTVGYLTQASVNAVAQAVTDAETYLASGPLTAEKSAEHQNAINVAIAALETVQPEEGKFYTIQNAYSNVYMGVSNTTGMVTSEEAGFGQVFQFVPAGEGVFYLCNVERGAYLNTAQLHGYGQNSAGVDIAEAKSVTIANLGKENRVSITPQGGATLHHDASYSTVVGWTGDANSRSAWKIVEVADMSALSHSVTITDAEWATLVLGCDATIPAGVKAYAVSAVGDGYANLTQVTGTIPANEAVLLNAVAGTYEFKYAAGSTPVENELVGTVFDTNVAADAYVLSAQGEPAVVGFYRAKLNLEENTKFKNNAFKAYLPATDGGEARFLVFNFGGETAIENIQGAENAADAVVYDLAGRRVQKAQKGLYIVNGVKVIK